eukprot:gene54239-22137_t
MGFCDILDTPNEHVLHVRGSIDGTPCGTVTVAPAAPPPVAALVGATASAAPPFPRRRVIPRGGGDDEWREWR